MTVYSNKRASKKRLVKNRLHIYNIILLGFVVLSLVGSVFVSNSTTAHRHGITSLRQDFGNMMLPVANASEKPAYSVPQLLEFAQARGMIEAVSAEALIHDSGVAVIR